MNTENIQYRPYTSELGKFTHSGLKLWVRENTSFLTYGMRQGQENKLTLANRTIKTYIAKVHKNFKGITFSIIDSHDKTIYKRRVNGNYKGIDYATLTVLLIAEFHL